MENEFSFLPLLLVVALAAGVPLVLGRFRRLRLPVVVGEILVGIAIGKSGLGLVGEDPWLAFLSTLGFAYLMLLSGLEVNLDALRAQFQTSSAGGRERGHFWRSPMALAGLVFALTLGAALATSLAIWRLGWVPSPWFLDLILSTTSLGIVVPVLKERHLLPTDYGQTLLLSATVADFVTMLLISLYAALYTKGFTLDLLLVLLLIGLFLASFRVILLLRQRVAQPLVRLERWLASTTAQMPVRVAFALGMAFIALAEFLGIEVILGAFLGGAIIALLSPEEGSELRSKLDAFGYGFFIPIFFIHVGTQLDLRTLAESSNALILVPVLIVVAFVVKMLPALLYRLRYDWRQTLGGGLLMSSRLSLIIAAAAIGSDLGLVSPTVNTAIVLVAVVTCTVAPLLFGQIVPRPTTVQREGIIIVGADDVGLSLLRRLSAHEETAVLVDAEATRCRRAESLGLPVVCGDARHMETLQRVPLPHPRVIVCVVRQAQVALQVCRLARKLYDPEAIVAWLAEPKDRPAFQQLGVRTVIPSLTVLEVLENVVRYPETFLFLSDLEEGGEREVREVALEDACWDGRVLRDMPLPAELFVLSIRRGDEFVIPRGSATLRQGDVLTVMGMPEAVEEAQQLCQGA
jgi:Kef-type K+ transport system membrane component KefB/Trk K+ transport system NAD-binding subunit